MKTIHIQQDGPVVTITLDRPEVKNAFNETVIAELTAAFRSLNAQTRVVVLTGSGDVFCAGADIAWMKKSIACSETENAHDADLMAQMFRAIDECPCAVIGAVNGHALGGGMGLVACCDIVVAVESAMFGFTEVRLGIVPAVIAPFSLRKIGARQARRYFLTGERFGVEQAQAMGLVHEIAAADELDQRVADLTARLLKSGPRAVAIAKQLIRDVPTMNTDTAHDHTVQTTARARTSPEGQEGLGAFLEKRVPNWIAPEST